MFEEKPFDLWLCEFGAPRKYFLDKAKKLKKKNSLSNEKARNQVALDLIEKLAISKNDPFSLKTSANSWSDLDQHMQHRNERLNRKIPQALAYLGVKNISNREIPEIDIFYISMFFHFLAKTPKKGNAYVLPSNSETLLNNMTFGKISDLEYEPAIPFVFAQLSQDHAAAVVKSLNYLSHNYDITFKHDQVIGGYYITDRGMQPSGKPKPSEYTPIEFTVASEPEYREFMSRNDPELYYGHNINIALMNSELTRLSSLFMKFFRSNLRRQGLM